MNELSPRYQLFFPHTNHEGNEDPDRRKMPWSEILFHWTQKAPSLLWNTRIVFSAHFSPDACELMGGFLSLRSIVQIYRASLVDKAPICGNGPKCGTRRFPVICTFLTISGKREASPLTWRIQISGKTVPKRHASCFTKSKSNSPSLPPSTSLNILWKIRPLRSICLKRLMKAIFGN